MSWRVPVDDEHYLTFNINLVHVTGTAADEFRQYRASQPVIESTMNMTSEILAGRARVDDFRSQVPDIVRLQDDVALGAQGAIPDRENECLGRSDIGVVILRRIWQRELRALANGQGLTHWSRPPTLAATNGLDTP